MEARINTLFTPSKKGRGLGELSSLRILDIVSPKRVVLVFDELGKNLGEVLVSALNTLEELGCELEHVGLLENNLHNPKAPDDFEYARLTLRKFDEGKKEWVLLKVPRQVTFALFEDELRAIEALRGHFLEPLKIDLMKYMEEEDIKRLEKVMENTKRFGYAFREESRSYIKNFLSALEGRKTDRVIVLTTDGDNKFFEKMLKELKDRGFIKMYDAIKVKSLEDVGVLKFAKRLFI